MADATAFAKLVPGFDFLQGLVKNAGAAMPGVGQWIAPTLDPEELDKRINDLKTVQFWLEQNARMLATTIQALEVQRMTLSTLKTMNLPVSELRKSFEMPVHAPEVAAPPPAPVAAPEPAPAPAPRKAARRSTAQAEAPAAAGPVDAMQWWGALTKQFTQLAATAMKDTATDAAERRRALSAAKVKIADAARAVSQEAVQLHGGMGMTEELKISHTFRRLTMIAQRFGDADHHLERYAALT